MQHKLHCEGLTRFMAVICYFITGQAQKSTCTLAHPCIQKVKSDSKMVYISKIRLSQWLSRRHRFDIWVWKIPGSREWHPYSCWGNPMDRGGWWTMRAYIEQCWINNLWRGEFWFRTKNTASVTFYYSEKGIKIASDIDIRRGQRLPHSLVGRGFICIFNWSPTIDQKNISKL